MGVSRSEQSWRMPYIYNVPIFLWRGFVDFRIPKEFIEFYNHANTCISFFEEVCILSIEQVFIHRR